MHVRASKTREPLSFSVKKTQKNEKEKKAGHVAPVGLRPTRTDAPTLLRDKRPPTLRAGLHLGPTRQRRCVEGESRVRSEPEPRRLQCDTTRFYRGAPINRPPRNPRNPSSTISLSPPAAAAPPFRPPKSPRLREDSTGGGRRRRRGWWGASGTAWSTWVAPPWP